MLGLDEVAVPYIKQIGDFAYDVLFVPVHLSIGESDFPHQLHDVTFFLG